MHDRETGVDRSTKAQSTLLDGFGVPCYRRGGVMSLKTSVTEKQGTGVSPCRQTVRVYMQRSYEED